MYCEWVKSTDSSRVLDGIYRGERNPAKAAKKVVNIAAKKAEILKELESLGYRLPGVN